MEEKRLMILERNLLKNPKKVELYCKAMREYVTNGWSEEIQEEKLMWPIIYRKPVYKPEKVSYHG